MTAKEISRIEKNIDNLTNLVKENHNESRKRFHELNTLFNSYMVEREKYVSELVKDMWCEADRRYSAKWTEKIVAAGVGLVMTSSLIAILSLIFIR